MILNKNLMFALTVTGGAAIALVLAVQRNARRQEAVQSKLALQVWENETGSLGPPAAAKAAP